MNETYQRGDFDSFKDSPLDKNGHNATVGQHFELSFLLSLIEEPIHFLKTWISECAWTDTWVDILINQQWEVDGYYR